MVTQWAPFRFAPQENVRLSHGAAIKSSVKEGESRSHSGPYPVYKSLCVCMAARCSVGPSFFIVVFQRSKSASSGLGMVISFPILMYAVCCLDRSLARTLYLYLSPSPNECVSLCRTAKFNLSLYRIGAIRNCNDYSVQQPRSHRISQPLPLALSACSAIRQSARDV